MWLWAMAWLPNQLAEIQLEVPAGNNQTGLYTNGPRVLGHHCDCWSRPGLQGEACGQQRAMYTPHSLRGLPAVSDGLPGTLHQFPVAAPHHHQPAGLEQQGFIL